MAQRTKIEWTQHTWNPVRGCNAVSSGCLNCYAAGTAVRLGGAGRPYEGTARRLPGQRAKWTGKIILAGHKIGEPFGWKKRRTVFVNSMSDLFHPGVPDAFIAAVCRVMAHTPWNTYQVLTKRAARLRDLLTGPLAEFAGLRHVWWGVSVENRAQGLPRVDLLRQVPAAVRFLSVEPLVEDLGPVDLAGIHWVIAGGESGPHARPLDPGWVRSLRDQCHVAGVKFFFKQWGGKNKTAAGRKLDGRTHDAMPRRSAVRVAMPRRQRELARQFGVWPVPSRDEGPTAAGRIALPLAG